MARAGDEVLVPDEEQVTRRGNRADRGRRFGCFERELARRGPVVAAVGRSAGGDVTKLRADDHEQLSIGQLDHFGLHRAAARLIDAVLTLLPGPAAVIRVVADADEMSAPFPENVGSRGDWADQPAAGELRDPV